MCCIAVLPRRRSRSARRKSDICSRKLGEGRLGGVIARIGSIAAANWLRNSMNRGYASASFVEKEPMLSRVFRTSFQMRSARSSPKTTSSGSGWMNVTPRDRRFKSSTISGRKSPHTDAPVGPRKPGAISSVVTGPPTAARLSRTRTRRRARARYVAVTRPLWPPPTITTSYASATAHTRSKAQSFRISRAAFKPGAPITPPPGWAPEPQR